MADIAPLQLPIPLLAGTAPLYVTGEESLQLTVFNSAAGVTVTLSGRFLAVLRRTDEGAPRPSPFAHSLVPTTNRVATVKLAALGEGWLMDGAVQVTAGTPLVGNTYVIVALVRGTAGAVTTLSVLAQGYITANQRIPLDVNVMQGFTDGPGALRAINGTQPGVGLEVTETVPTGARWELLSFLVSLVTSATGANRTPVFFIDDGTNVYYEAGGGTNETASVTWTNILAPIGAGFVATAVAIVNVPAPIGIRLGAGHRIRTSTPAIQVGDQYGVPHYLVREWIEG